MKKVSITLVLLATIGVVCAVVFPGASRIRRYEKAFSGPGALAVLSRPPVRVDLPRDAGEPNFSLGYARFRLDPESVRSIERRGDDKSVVMIQVEEYDLLLMSPFANTSLNLDEPVARTLPNAPLSQHDLMLRVAMAAPKTWLELFFMPEEQFKVYLAEAVVKTITPRNQFGIGLFETDGVEGIIHFGDVSHPGSLLAGVVSRKGDIGQGIYLRAATPEGGLKLFREILASFSFTIDRAPERREEIAGLVLEAVRTHPKFRE